MFTFLTNTNISVTMLLKELIRMVEKFIAYAFDLFDEAETLSELRDAGLEVSKRWRELTMNSAIPDEVTTKFKNKMNTLMIQRYI